MKQPASLTSKLLVLSFALSIFTACTKEGPAGPEGPAGTIGPQGIKGDKGDQGAANVFYSNWVTITQSQWSGIGTSRLSTNISAPKLTQDIIDKGIILVYHSFGGSYKLLPFAYSALGTHINFTFNVGEITITVYAQNGAPFNSIFNMEYRYVLIPGGVTARKAAPSGRLDYTDYQAVCRFYGIPE